MHPIPVEPYPIGKSYSSFRAAIDGANQHPQQQQARADSERLVNATLVTANWSNQDIVIQFTGELFLHMFAKAGNLEWSLSDTPPAIEIPNGIGTQPQILAWPKEIGEKPMDLSCYVEKRIGCEFRKLFVNEFGLWLYMKSQPILTIMAIRRTDTDSSMLYFCEEE